ncbi:MAG: D-2-hydroxyacid dehydrogenase [Tindallia sp. MSAO_Bac2]|nr:MAG: D-2-hydroxyacid dehydrogenase [Tindallia sp. MSAO_Bac2]
MKIVVLDGYTLNPGDLSWEAFEKMGDLEVYDRTGYDMDDQDKVIERAKDADVILTNKTPITEEALRHMDRLKYIGMLATGYNVVDVEAATQKGVALVNVPTYGTEAVAQMTFALLLEVCHHVGAHHQAVKEGEWARNPDWSFWKFPLIELAGKTMGIVGYGRIGQAVGKIAEAMGMNLVVNSRSIDPAFQAQGVRYVERDELFKEADVVSLHCPLFPDTEAMINKRTLKIMKETAILINTSRGQLVSEQDLADALNSDEIAAAAVDVVSREPILSSNPLLNAKNCLITPHIAWAPTEARVRLMSLAADNLRQFLDGKPINVVNPEYSSSIHERKD